MSSRTTLQERYRDEYRHLHPAWKDSLRLYRDLVADSLPPGGAVLDLGCGHADWLGPELVHARLACGADGDLQALRRNQVSMHRVAARAEQLPFADGSFDVVVMAWVLEHLEFPGTALREVRRVLRPGGRMVFLTPNAWNYNIWLIRLVPNRMHDFLTRRLYGRQESDTYPVRYRANTPPQLDRVLAAAGLCRRQMAMNGDPSYLSFHPVLFAIWRVVERALDLPPLQRARVHILGVYEAV